jgi:hypothetical protein
MRKEASPGERRLGAARTRGRDDRLYDLAGRLTERDRRICRLLYDHRVLTTAQVADVGFDSLRKAQERLSILYALEVVDRFCLRSWSGTSPYHLVLGTAGAALIAAERGVTLADLAWHKETATALSTNRQLAHLVGCNGVLTALLRTARTRPGCHLDEWWSARRCAAAWGEIVRPDAYAVWVEHGVRLPFFLEYDTGTEALRRLAAKLDGYARLARAVGHPTWVLFAFPSVGREAAARRVLRHPVVPVATAVLGPHTAPDGPVWQAIGDQRAAGRLVDLGHVLQPIAVGLHHGTQPGRCYLGHQQGHIVAQRRQVYLGPRRPERSASRPAHRGVHRARLAEVPTFHGGAIHRGALVGSSFEDCR